MQNLEVVFGDPEALAIDTGWMVTKSPYNVFSEDATHDSKYYAHPGVVGAAPFELGLSLKEAVEIARVMRNNPNWNMRDLMTNRPDLV